MLVLWGAEGFGRQGIRPGCRVERVRQGRYVARRSRAVTFFAEEEPDVTLTALRDFLTVRGTGRH